MKVILGTGGTSAVPEFGGSTWVRMQYVLGLARLGVETLWVEHLPEVDPLTHHHSLEYLVERFAATAQRFGFADDYCLVYNHGERFFGASAEELRGMLRSADALINISGKLPLDLDPLLARIPRRAYVDVDPGFTQIWARQWPAVLEPYQHFFTTGMNVGEEPRIPSSDVAWIPVLPPVVLEQWPAHIDTRCRRYRTVADWRGSQTAEWNGTVYEGKRSQFLRIRDLPRRTEPSFELALCIGQHDHADLRTLTEHGWKVRDPYSTAGDPLSYREFIRYARAELSVAKHGYAALRSGWVSDRTACFLASGKPAVVQSTGFESTLPTGCGLLAFSDVDEAADAVRAVERDYEAQCRAARRLAEDHFDSDKVLARLLDELQR